MNDTHPIDEEYLTYQDGRRAVWREVLTQAVAALGLDDAPAQAAAWALERQEVETELRGLWSDYVFDHKPGQRPGPVISFPEGVSLAEALRRFGEYL